MGSLLREKGRREEGGWSLGTGMEEENRETERDKHRERYREKKE